MRAKAFFSSISRPSIYMMICLLMMLLAFGCKQKTEDVGGDDQKKEARREGQVKEFAFGMQEVTVFDVASVSRDFIRGQTTICNDRRGGGKYPVFKSDKPLYGSIRFRGSSATSHSSDGYHFAIDEAGGSGTGYDLLYFDRNGDLDLTDEEPLKTLKNPPERALLGYSSTLQEVCFDSFDMTFDLGSSGNRAIEIMPRLMVRNAGRAQLSFVATKVHKGRIDLEGTQYDALLGYGYSVGVPFDQPGAVFCLTPESDPQHPPRWWGADNLNSMHALGGKYYHFAATPTGDKLFARLYEGALGTFEVGTGARDLQDVTIYGSLRSEDTAVAVGGELENGMPKPAKSCLLPEGDYMPAFLSIKFGNLSISVSNNYHADGKPFGHSPEVKVYGIKIRKDKPFVLDFSNDPDVMFASPAKGYGVKLGGELQVKAVLIDPELDIMIRRLYDQEKTRVSLDPKVLITRSGGEKIAEGVMPFG
jgi:hypothetical protein